MQTLSDRDHEHLNEHTGIDSDSPYPAVNHADVLPPTTYTGAMGNEDPPYMAIVSGHIISLYVHFADGGCAEGLGTIPRKRKSTST